MEEGAAGLESIKEETALREWKEEEEEAAPEAQEGEREIIRG